MPSQIRTGGNIFGSRLGYQSYGMPQNVQVARGNGRLRYNLGGAGIGTPGVLIPPVATPSVQMGWPERGVAAVQRRATVPGGPPMRTASGKGARWKLPSSFNWTKPGPAVSASAPQTAALGGFIERALSRLPGGYGTTGANVPNPVYGTGGGMTYLARQPAGRLGTAPKLAPGSGGKGSQANRSQGFVPPAYSDTQYVDLHQFDYQPVNDATFDVGMGAEQRKTLPRSIGKGDDGGALFAPTYKPHDFTPADRFFKQGRSTQNWQDMSFGPDYRWLQPAQQVARYNLYSEIQLARTLSPNAYFLGYQTQPGVAAQLSNSGMAAPLGYGAH